MAGKFHRSPASRALNVCILRLASWGGGASGGGGGGDGGGGGGLECDKKWPGGAPKARIPSMLDNVPQRRLTGHRIVFTSQRAPIVCSPYAAHTLLLPLNLHSTSPYALVHHTL
jgi:hypothetical protein